jgi:hypothetical protein
MEEFHVQFHFDNADAVGCDIAASNLEALLIHIQKEFRNEGFFRFDRGEAAVCIHAATLRFFTITPSGVTEPAPGWGENRLGG